MSTTTMPASPRRKLPNSTKRAIRFGVLAVVVLGVALGTKVVSSQDPRAQGNIEFDPSTFGSGMFPTVQEGVTDRAVDAETLAAAIADDPAAAADEYSVKSSGGPVYSVEFTGVVGEGQSGIYEVDVEGVPDELLIRVQTGPAINGTELRDATGEIEFGHFKNQIDFQNAAAALNDELKTAVLADVIATNLQGKTITVTGAFTLINPASWLVTPVEIKIQ